MHYSFGATFYTTGIAPCIYGIAVTNPIPYATLAASPLLLPTVAVAAATGAGVLIYNIFSHTNGNTNDSRDEDPIPGPSDDTKPPTIPLPAASISSRQMKKVLEEWGEDMKSKAAKTGIPEGKFGKVYSNTDIRLDAGSEVHGLPGLKHVNVQCNSKPDSKLGKSLLNQVGGDTHTKLFHGIFDRNSGRLWFSDGKPLQ